MQIFSSVAIWFLPFVLAIGVWVAWSDMKFMRIPNKAVIALTGVYLVLGAFLLPFETYLWQMTHLLLVLVIGFVLNITGLIGAGDAKFAAAMAPFVALGDLRLFLVLFSAVLIASFISHRVAGMVPVFRNMTADWESWHRKEFPMGLALAGGLIFYIALGARYGS